uniref:EKC/KEOPS complex subunit GON7 isoform X2 n=1 Tax=Jaculus jaculus TaxID=51337 RepID=UPI001E1B190A|nr:EKC/KEOPS complex subunit GON7 isoform X2 [Jaculus jaculus]XP_045010322.1 EKC/KEOPS complex subunit GON7 isoform X2 [Jaculus jaculus]
MELSAEYVGPGGEPQRLRASCEPAGDADRLRGLSSGVAHMKELVAEFFGALARRDAQGGAAEAAATADDALDDKKLQIHEDALVRARTLSLTPKSFS